MQRRGEFSFPGSPARGQQLPPRPPAGSGTAARYAGEAEDEEVRWLQASRQASPDYGSGTPSPQLWAYDHHHNPERHNQHHRLYPASAGSSPSRAQAIAGYRREMLDLVRGLPESAYELSLRDIVEHHPATASSPSPSSSPPPTTHPDPLPPPSNASAAQEHRTAAAAATHGSDETASVAAGVEDGKKQSKKQGRKQRTFRKQRSRSLERSVSLDTGLLIKLFLPLSMGGKKKKVSPRPDAAKDGKKKEKKKNQGKKKEASPAQEEEWWSKGEFSEAGSSSRTSSTGSSNSSAGSIRNNNGHVNGSSVSPRAPARSWSRKRTGCYAFFRANKGKNGASQD